MILAISIKIFEKSTLERFLYLKYSIKLSKLKIYNVPLYLDHDIFSSILQDIKIKSDKFVIEDGLDDDGRHLIISFKSSKLKERVLEFFKNHTYDKPLIIYDRIQRSPKLNGYKKYCNEYKESELTKIARLNTEINNYMVHYDKLVEMEREAHAKTAVKGNEEGWTVVQHKGNSSNIVTTNSINNSSLTRLKKRKKPQFQTNLYTTRLKKTVDCTKLQKMFEEDKARIAHMKANRKFKPF